MLLFRVHCWAVNSEKVTLCYVVHTLGVILQKGVLNGIVGIFLILTDAESGGKHPVTVSLECILKGQPHKKLLFIGASQSGSGFGLKDLSLTIRLAEGKGYIKKKNQELFLGPLFRQG